MFSTKPGLLKWNLKFQIKLQLTFRHATEVDDLPWSRTLYCEAKHSTVEPNALPWSRTLYRGCCLFQSTYQQEVVILWFWAKIFENGLFPKSLHQIPIINNTMSNWPLPKNINNLFNSHIFGIQRFTEHSNIMFIHSKMFAKKKPHSCGHTIIFLVSNFSVKSS